VQVLYFPSKGVVGGKRADVAQGHMAGRSLFLHIKKAGYREGCLWSKEEEGIYIIQLQMSSSENLWWVLVSLLYKGITI
jgi:hypothetical protein